MSVIYYVPSQTEHQQVGLIQLAHGDRAPYLARQAVRAWLGNAHPAREIVTLAASELVTNAVKHTVAGAGAVSDSDSITLRLSRGSDHLRLAVTDPGSSCTEPSSIPLQTPSLSAERGRGLAIVETLSRGRWGSYRVPLSRSRLVWCHLDLDPTPAQLEDLFRAPV